MFTVKGISKSGVTILIEGYKIKKEEATDSIYVDVFSSGDSDEHFYRFEVTNNLKPEYTVPEKIIDYIVTSVIIENGAGKTSEVIRAID